MLQADDDLRMLPCRRTTFEWVMRRTVLAEAGIDLVARSGRQRRRAACRAPTVRRPSPACDSRTATLLAADLVVATTGRRGDVPAWLAAHGITITETEDDAGVVYFSRFYRSDHDEEFGFRGGFGAGLIAGVIGADAGTYSITAVVDRRRQGAAGAPHATPTASTPPCASLPELADVAAADGAPIHPVHCMTGLINRTRSFTDATGTPLVGGLIACGDAHTCTNPAYGRGQSLALRQATFIADAVAEHDDLLEAGRAYEAASAEQVTPWYHFSVLTDQMRASASGGDRVAAAERRERRVRRDLRQRGQQPGAVAARDAGDEPARAPAGAAGEAAGDAAAAADRRRRHRARG